MNVFGWLKRPEEVKKVLSGLPRPYFSSSAKHLMQGTDDKDGLLYMTHKKLFGKHMPAQNQPRGTCVSRGWSRGVDYIQLVAILQGAPLDFKLVSHAYIYGCSREVGGDLSYQDGSVGAWAAKAVSTMGNVTNDEASDRDAGYDDLAVEWGAKGVPQAMKDLAKDNLIKTVSLVRTAEEARVALVNLNPVICCSDQGFTMQRDSEGRCTPQGVWQHCMMWSGYHAAKRRFLVEQSWGQMTPSGPLFMDQPDNSFWIDWDVADRMLRQEDSFAATDLDAWIKKELSWYV